MPEGIETVFRSVTDNIEEYGIAVLGIFPTSDYDGPAFCYTAGMAAIGQPEVIIFFPDLARGQTFLNDLCIPVTKGGEPLKVGQVDGLFGNGVPAMLIETDEADAAEYVTVSARIAGKESVPVMQLCWPDAEGRWPWEHESKAVYPLLGEPPL